MKDNDCQVSLIHPFLLDVRLSHAFMFTGLIFISNTLYQVQICVCY